ncbi:MAG: HDIG domain-containing protein [Ruminococcus sp.]|jgi:uncharacterized protein|nr:HDIG domain-containing protein [Ruminococcus sp.]
MNDEFKKIIDNLITDEVLSLQNYKHHIYSNRLKHCLNVSYASYKIAKKLNLDYISTARAALLHDLYFYNRGEVKQHSRVHPMVSLHNARKYGLNSLEKTIIVKHMKFFNKKREVFLVQCVDKFCAVKEFLRI